MNKLIKKISCIIILLILANAAIAETHEKGENEEKREYEEKGEYDKKGQHGRDDMMEKYHKGMSSCYMGKEVRMEKMGKDEKSCIGCMKVEMIIKHAKALELSKDQIDKIKELGVECSKNNIKKQAEIDILKIDKSNMLKKDEIDFNAVKKVVTKLYELKGEKALGCIETYTKVKKVLDSKQAEKLKEIKKKTY